MKYLLIFFVSMTTFCKAQYLVEDFDVTENSSEFGVSKINFNLNDRLEHYRLSCEGKIDYSYFSMGEESFRTELSRNLLQYLDNEQYAVNGRFSLVFEINSNGELNNIQIFPKVKNGEMLYKDIEFALKRIKNKWIPATCNGVSVNSKLRLKINFGTENFDR